MDFSAEGSLPASGSVSAYAKTTSPVAAFVRYLCFCSSFPHSWTVRLPSAWWTSTYVMTPRPSCPNLSSASACTRGLEPSPPYFFDIGIPMRRCFLTTSGILSLNFLSTYFSNSGRTSSSHAASTLSKSL